MLEYFKDYSAWRYRGLCLAALAPLLWLVMVTIWGAFYSFPQTDDFCAYGRLFMHEAYNPFVDIWHMYLFWSGRYSAVLTVALAGWLTSIAPWSAYATYHISVILLIIVFIAGCVLATSALSTSKFVNAAVAGIACAASLTLMPSRLEGVYWVSGAAVYITGVGVFLALIRSMMRDDHFCESHPHANYSFTSLALIVFCVGFNELLALSLGELLLLRMMFFSKRGVYLRQNLIYGFVYTTSFLVSVCAPGNFVRDKTSHLPRHEFGEAARLALGSLSQFMHGVVVPNNLVLFVMLVGTAAFTWAMKPGRFITFERMAPVALTLLSAVPMHLFVYSFLTGEEAPGRTINQCYVMALVGGCILAAWVGAFAGNKMGKRTYVRTACVMLCATGVMFIASAPFRQVVNIIRDFGPIWSAEQLERANTLQAGRGNAVVLAPFTAEGDTPPLLQGTDISKDPSYWVNSCMSGYYGLKDVRLQEKQ